MLEKVTAWLQKILEQIRSENPNLNPQVNIENIQARISEKDRFVSGVYNQRNYSFFFVRERLLWVFVLWESDPWNFHPFGIHSASVRIHLGSVRGPFAIRTEKSQIYLFPNLLRNAIMYQKRYL